MGKPSKFVKTAVIILLVLNLVVMLGQLWPEGAPPFAGTVNIAFLTLNALFLIATLARKTS